MVTSFEPDTINYRGRILSRIGTFEYRAYIEKDIVYCIIKELPKGQQTLLDIYWFIFPESIYLLNSLMLSFKLVNLKCLFLIKKEQNHERSRINFLSKRVYS